MESESSASPAPLDYAGQRTPPYLDVTGDGVRLVMPPMPRGLALTMVVASGLAWVGIVASAAALGIASLRWNIPLPYRSLPMIVLAVGAAVHTVVLARTVAWFVTRSRSAPFIGVSGDCVEYTSRGLRRPTVRRPLARVRDVSAKEISGLGGTRWVEVNIRLRPFGFVKRRFRSPGDGFADEVQRAFDTALAARGAGGDGA